MQQQIRRSDSSDSPPIWLEANAW